MKARGLFFVGLCFALSGAYAKGYTIGEFVALRGPTGSACQATETRTRCAPGTSVTCGVATKSGYRISRTTCTGSSISGYEYLYDGDTGPTGNPGCSITASKTVTYEDPNDNTSRIVKTTVALHDTCDGDNHEDDLTFDVENGEDGEQGIGISYQDDVDDCNGLTAYTSTAQLGDAYFNRADGKLYIFGASGFPACGQGATFQGPQGPQGPGVCTNYENDATAVKNTVRSYAKPEGKTTSGNTVFYTSVGKLNLTHKMCKTGVSDKVDTQEDICIPIIAPSGICASGTYYECTPQGTYTGNTNYSKYNLCKTTTGTTIASAVANKADAGTVSTLVSTVGDSSSGLVKDVDSLKTTVGDSSSGLVQQTANLETTVGNSSSGLVKDVNSLKTTVGSSSSGLVKDVNSLKTTVGSSSSGLVKKANDLETALGNKLDNDVSFSTSGGYIKMTAGGTTVNVATVASLKGDKGDKGDTGNNGSSIFDIWKAQQTNATTCQKLFGKTCSNLTESDMLQDLSAYGNWARTTYAGNSSADLSQTAFQNSLKPCQSYSVIESDNQSGTNGGKRYDLICNN